MNASHIIRGNLGQPTGASLEELIKRAQQESQQGALTKAVDLPANVNRAGSFSVVELNMTNSGFSDLPPGYALYLLREGSHPGARITISGAGSWENMAPGEWFEGYFDGLKVARGSRSTTSGILRVLVIRSPGVLMGVVPETNSAGVFGGGVVGPNGAVTQTRNSAAGNVPTATTDGVNISGCRGFRVVISAADAGETLSGAGTLRLWKLSDRGAAAVSNVWRKSTVAYDQDLSAVKYVEFPEEALAVPEGRVYAEAVSVTNSAGDLVVAVETWG